MQDWELKGLEMSETQNEQTTQYCLVVQEGDRVSDVTLFRELSRYFKTQVIFIMHFLLAMNTKQWMDKECTKYTKQIYYVQKYNKKDIIKIMT